MTERQHAQEIDPLLGETIDARFTLLSVLGRGFSSTVYLAQDKDKKRALKLLAQSHAQKPSLHERFLRETKILRSIEHPNIIRVYDAGSYGDRPYLVMEHLRGHSLATEVAQGPLQPGRAVRIISQVLQALEEAHKHGIIHRDIKPANIFLAQQGLVEEVKVLDFGIAKNSLDDTEEALTTDGVCYGTPQYMSPEQTQGDNLDARSDLYSVGVVLYELLCGKRPFVGKSALEIASKQVRERATPLAQQLPSLREHPALQAVVEKAMAKSPNRRDKSASAMREALEKLWTPKRHWLPSLAMAASLLLLTVASWHFLQKRSASQLLRLGLHGQRQDITTQNMKPTDTKLLPGKNLLVEETVGEAP